jgi:hypothetical protein
VIPTTCQPLRLVRSQRARLGEHEASGEDLCFIGGWCLFCGTCLILFDGIIDDDMTYIGPEVSLALSIIEVD